MKIKELNKKIELSGLKKSYLAEIIGVTPQEFSMAINEKRTNDKSILILHKLEQLLKE